MLPFLLATLAAPERVSFPKDPAVIDVRDLGAVGDGVADDTAALQRGLDMSSGEGGNSRILYLPNGTYRITDTLVVKSPIGPWMYGESRDGVVIRLDDGRQGLTSALRTHPNDGGDTSADWFMRNFRHFTLDVGENPEVDGIRWCATNSGILHDLTIRGNGAVGINAGFIGEHSPNLIHRVEVQGFRTGVKSHWGWGQTLSQVTLRNPSEVGVSLEGHVLSMEDLVIEGAPLALDIRQPNDWFFWSGVAALVGGRFQGSGPAAILNRGVLWARDVEQTGYDTLLDEHGTLIPSFTEHVPGPIREAFPAGQTSLGLPIKPHPEVAWENDHSKWVCANDFGAVPGDGQDDTAAFRAAFDHAAQVGATVVYLRGIGGPDPNWYQLSEEVRVPAPVRWVIALGFGRILDTGGGAFVVDDGSAETVVFRHLDSFGGPPPSLIHRGADNAMVVESSGVRIVGEGEGDIFVLDAPSLVDLRVPGQSLWARHLNPEGDIPGGAVRNNGGNLWILGLKSEGLGVKFHTLGGGRTEVLGMFMYGPGAPENYDQPMILVEDSDFSITALREITFGQHTYAIKARELRAGQMKDVGTLPGEHWWIGWGLFTARGKP